MPERLDPAEPDRPDLRRGAASREARLRRSGNGLTSQNPAPLGVRDARLTAHRRGNVMTPEPSTLCLGCWQNMSLPVVLRGPLSVPYRAFGIKPSRMNPNT